LLVDVSENEHHPIIVQQWTGGVAGDVLLRLSNWRCALNQGRLLQGSRRESQRQDDRHVANWAGWKAKVDGVREQGTASTMI
jgi:hypothetical protein